MDKVDRLGWAVGASFEGHGLSIGVRANSDQALDAVLVRLPPGLKAGRSTRVDRLYSVIDGGSGSDDWVRRYSLAYEDSLQLERSMDFESVLAAVDRRLSIYLAEFAKDRLFIHAGVVGWNGRAIIVPGKSLAGKSTLVWALLSAGATYYSDEFAVVDQLGWVHPYPTALHLRNGDVRIPPDKLPSPVGQRPLTVGRVLATSYRPGARWQARKLSQGHGLLTLLSNTVSAQRNPGRALATLKQMLTGAEVLGGVRGEADAMVSRLLRAGSPGRA